jgi:23S rRNA pseudouridine1911/1915/1917 synthase
MPAREWGWEITREELESWVIGHTQRWLAVNKPGLVVCHPSKHGPWSSLVGAAREYLGLERLHMPFRLDRETSGLVLLVKDASTASLLQRAVERRRVSKTYLAILEGELREPATVNAAIGAHPSSTIRIRRGVVETGQDAVTHFLPLAHGGGYTLARVRPETGRLHQIRVHAAHIGHAVAGDKIYGPDETLFLEFIAKGFSGELERRLPLRRHALHCLEARFQAGAGLPEDLVFRAPFAADLAAFCRERMGVDPSACDL